MTHTVLYEAILALSARTQALELAVATLAEKKGPPDALVARFDAMATNIIDRYGALPVEEEFLELLRMSLENVRRLLDRRPIPGRTQETVPVSGSPSKPP